MNPMSSKGYLLSSNKYSDFKFKVPPEAPVFEPTDEDFENPLRYIDKIRPVAEKCGICKIRPPPEWQPPFAMDIDNFKFTPRVQKLNELEAKTRIRLNFLDKIAKFWELQGSRLSIPLVEGRILDLYSLYRLVKMEGGSFAVTRERKWNIIANQMGLSIGRSSCSTLKSHYNQILFPYDVFQSNKVKLEKKCERSSVVRNDNKRGKCSGTTRVPKTKKKIPLDIDPLAKYVCINCHRGDIEESMLLCDGCDDSYHTFCLIPPLNQIPKGDWRCPKCLAKEVSKPVEAFGFTQAQREYTLQEFGEMADKFKTKYFSMPVHCVPTEVVEKEFWRIVSTLDADITVEYGADLHSVDHGSGFPTKFSINITEDPEFDKYIASPWNLNNLPVLPGSVFSFINADISGMKIPWMYVGMCFATFCWHNEDHWSYSINYLHWGEPKTWYGVPGGRAEDFEKAMKKAAPELFENQPDLLHQLTTIMNPNVLMQAGVPVYRTDQQAGEFIVTFPRAYHAGFNQGYNFAEAVNFAPGDWIQIGRECIGNYSTLHRYCVFSHDELVCRMANDCENIDPKLAAAAYSDMLNMAEIEKNLRQAVRNWGITDSENVFFELLPDDERQCEICKTTCYLSAVYCRCDPTKSVCLLHYRDLCCCPSRRHVLRYRYSLDELPIMLQKLKLKAEFWNVWMTKVQKVIDTHETIDADTLKRLISEAKEKSFPQSELITSLSMLLSNYEYHKKILKSYRCSVPALTIPL